MNESFDHTRSEPSAASSPDPRPSGTVFADTGQAEPAAAPQSGHSVLPSRAPQVTYMIIGVTVFVYLLQISTLRFLGTDIPAALGIKANQLIRAGQLWRLLTPMLLHDDTGVWHIGFNMYFLLIVGARVERLLGHWRFLILYILSGFSGDVLSFAASPYYSWGASGALFGLLGCEAMLAYQNRSIFKDSGYTMLKNALLVALINILIGFFIGADNWGHVGGLLGGLMFTWFAGPRWQVEGILPDLHLVDQREPREVLTGAAAVVLIFGSLAMIGIIYPIVP